jgi:hypothetical protein
MIRRISLPLADPEVEDPSMRMVEWAMALIAVVAAGVLALIR